MRCRYNWISACIAREQSSARLIHLEKTASRATLIIFANQEFPETNHEEFDVIFFHGNSVHFTLRLHVDFQD